MWTEEENPPESTTFVIIGVLTGTEHYMWHFPLDQELMMPNEVYYSAKLLC